MSMHDACSELIFKSICHSTVNEWLMLRTDVCIYMSMYCHVNERLMFRTKFCICTSQSCQWMIDVQNWFLHLHVTIMSMKDWCSELSFASTCQSHVNEWLMFRTKFCIYTLQSCQWMVDVQNWCLHIHVIGMSMKDWCFELSFASTCYSHVNEWLMSRTDHHNHVNERKTQSQVLFPTQWSYPLTCKLARLRSHPVSYSGQLR